MHATDCINSPCVHGVALVSLAGSEFLEGLDHISEAGYSKLFTAMSLALKKELCNILRCHFTVYRNILVMNQLKTDLAELDVLDAMTRFPNLFEPFFICDKQGPLTAGVY